jgi:hypothetical protein
MVMVNFKIGFEVSGEVLFGLLAKFLPVDNLSVEEVRPKAPPTKPALARLNVAQVKKLAKPQRAKRKSNGLNLSEGINGIIVGILSDGQPHRATDLEDPLKAKGYSGNSVGSRLQNLRAHGIVEQIGGGKWLRGPAFPMTESHLPKQKQSA